MLRVTVVEGRDVTQTFVVHRGSAGVGTAPDNQIILTDGYVSRHHGRLAFVGGTWYYRDLGSRNGTVREHAGGRREAVAAGEETALTAGDLLLLGETRLELEVLKEPDPEPEGTVVASRDLAEAQLRRERLLATHDGLRAVYQLAGQAGPSFDPRQTLEAVLEALLVAFPAATHASVLLVDRKTRAPRRHVVRVRGEESRAGDEVPMSRSLVARVLEEGHSLLLANAPRELPEADSVAAAHIASALCAPLWTGDETVGLLQVDNRASAASFTEEDLDRLNLIAGRAALAIVSSELQESERHARLLQDLTEMVNHDLTSPLASLLVFLEMLSEEPLAERPGRLVRDALSCSQWLSVLVAGLVDVARMEAGAVPLRQEPVDLRGEIAWALDLMDYQRRAREVRVEVTAAPDLPPVAADREFVRRILVNLAANAVRFSPPRGRLSISARRDAGAREVTVSVRDEGPGIPPGYRERIFEKFVQVEAGRPTEKICVGLGLAFCRLAVEAHAGHIWVDSEPGRGACFSFTLPVAENGS